MCAFCQGSDCPCLHGQRNYVWRVDQWSAWMWSHELKIKTTSESLPDVVVPNFSLQIGTSIISLWVNINRWRRLDNHWNQNFSPLTSSSNIVEIPVCKMSEFLHPSSFVWKLSTTILWNCNVCVSRCFAQFCVAFVWFVGSMTQHVLYKLFI